MLFVLVMFLKCATCSVVCEIWGCCSVREEFQRQVSSTLILLDNLKKCVELLLVIKFRVEMLIQPGHCQLSAPCHICTKSKLVFKTCK